MKRAQRPQHLKALTILELLVSMAVLMLVAVLSYSILSAATTAWKGQQARANAFEGARTAFELLSNRLSQATLNTYWDYNDPANPTAYLRKSELHYTQGRASDLLPSLQNTSTDAVFFVAPLGFASDTDNEPLVKMLTGCGLYVRFSGDPNRPEILDPLVASGKLQERYRFRLYQFLHPGEELRVYDPSLPANGGWFQTDVQNWSFPMAENVIGLILRARYPVPLNSPDSGANGRLPEGQAERYIYDSRAGSATNPPDTYHQLPSVVSVTMVVIDEDSARQLADRYQTTPPPILPDPTAFTDPDNYAQDLANWEAKLRGETPALSQKVSYRVLTAEIPIRGAKWSSGL